jgi:hypothetical protein
MSDFCVDHGIAVVFDSVDEILLVLALDNGFIRIFELQSKERFILCLDSGFAGILYKYPAFIAFNTNRSIPVGLKIESNPVGIFIMYFKWRILI